MIPKDTAYNTTCNFFSHLPEDIVVHICHFLNGRPIFALSRVTQELYKLISSSIPLQYQAVIEFAEKNIHLKNSARSRLLLAVLRISATLRTRIDNKESIMEVLCGVKKANFSLEHVPVLIKIATGLQEAGYKNEAKKTLFSTIDVDFSKHSAHTKCRTFQKISRALRQAGYEQESKNILIKARTAATQDTHSYSSAIEEIRITKACVEAGYEDEAEKTLLPVRHWISATQHPFFESLDNLKQTATILLKTDQKLGKKIFYLALSIYKEIIDEFFDNHATPRSDSECTLLQNMAIALKKAKNKDEIRNALLSAKHNSTFIENPIRMDYRLQHITIALKEDETEEALPLANIHSLIEQSAYNHRTTTVSRVRMDDIAAIKQCIAKIIVMNNSTTTQRFIPFSIERALQKHNEYLNTLSLLDSLSDIIDIAIREKSTQKALKTPQNQINSTIYPPIKDSTNISHSFSTEPLETVFSGMPFDTSSSQSSIESVIERFERMNVP